MNGIIIVDKPKEFTSNDVVCKVKKILNEKVGHTGTLDPNATGVLPLLIGKGTLLSKYLINHDKKYEAVIKLGIKTDTADVEGKIIEEKDVNKDLLTKENIIKVFNNMVGEQEQVPPMYSAIKVNGKKLYEYARCGKNVDIKPRKINIYSLELKNINIEEREITYIVNCSKGTYIRTLCENIAEKLETIGYMKELRRLQVGDFKIEDAVSVKDIENGKLNIISIEDFFKENKNIVLNEKDITLFLNGVRLTKVNQDGLYKIYSEDNVFIGIGIIKNNLLKREIVL